MLVFFVLLAVGQMLDSFNMRMLGFWRYGPSGTIIPISDSIVYTKAGRAKYILDVSDPTHIVKLDSIPGGPTSAFSRAGNLLLSGEFNEGLRLYDISDERHPRLISQYITPGYPFGCDFRDGYAFAGCFTEGLRIIDYHNPYQPVETGFYPLPSTTYEVKVQDSFAYVGNWVGGFKVLDVSNLRAPFQVFSYQHPRGWPVRQVAIQESIAVIGFPVIGGGGFEVWNITNPTSPVQLGGVTGIRCEGLQFINDTLIMMASDRSSFIFDIKDPSLPQQVARLRARSGCVLGNRCYGLDFDLPLDTMFIFDISDPANPVLLGTFSEFHTYTEDIFAAGDYAYAATRGQGMKVYDITDPRNPTFVAQFGDGIWVSTVVVRDTLAYLGCSGTPGLRIVNIRNPLIPVEVVAVDSVWDVNAILLQDTIAFLAGDCCWILDIKDPTAPRILARMERGPSRQAFWGCAVVDNFLLTTESYGGMRVFDISDLANPVPVAHCDTIEAVHGIKVKFPYVFLTGSYGLLVFDISDPKEPEWVTHHQTINYPWDIEIAGNIAYVANDLSGVKVFDISNPALPQEVGYYNLDYGRRVMCNDGLVYLACSDGWASLEYYGQGVEEKGMVDSVNQRLLVSYLPFSQNLRVKLLNRQEGVKMVEVFNSAGIKVASVKKESTSGVETVMGPFSFADGVYFVKVSTDRQSYTAKFTVVK